MAVRMLSLIIFTVIQDDNRAGSCAAQQ